MTTVSFDMPAHCDSLADVRSRIIRSSYDVTYGRAVFEFIDEPVDNSFVIYAEWDRPGYLTRPFQVSVTYANNSLQYTLLTRGIDTAYFRNTFIPRVHPR